jgi:uncharacterized membrane protein
MGTWFSLKTILALISNVLGFFRELMSNIAAERNKQAGRDEANADTLRQNAERVAEGKKAEEEAERIHRERGDSDSAFDTSFRRD